MSTVIIRPLITEKSMAQAGQKKYTFVVETTAKKDEIKRDIEKKFLVHVTSIATIRVKGKTKRTGSRRIETTIPVIKKAIVTLKSGEKIGLFEANA